MSHRKDQNTDWYLSLFDALENGPNGFTQSPQFPLRKQAITRFAELGFPAPRAEAWKYTNISSVVKTPFDTVQPDEKNHVTTDQLQPYLFQDLSACTLVFINGVYAAELSARFSSEADVHVAPLSELVKLYPEDIGHHLGKYAAYDDHAFTALNTAFMQDGACLIVPDHTRIEKPVHIVYVSTAHRNNISSYPRNLYVIGRNSRASCIESYIGTGANTYLTNVVSEVVLEPNAVFDHYKLQEENRAGYHFAALHVHQEQDSTYTNFNISLGSLLARNDIHGVLNAEGIESTLNGLYIGDGKQLLDTHSLVEHVKPYCHSAELYKGILKDATRGVFNGKIYVHPHAVKTDAVQANNNLLLSDNARVDTKPELEIYADDVKCTHGGTVGKLNNEAVFYLRSRGIPEQEARNILTLAFVEEVLTEMQFDQVRQYVHDTILKRLKDN